MSEMKSLLDLQARDYEQAWRWKYCFWLSMDEKTRAKKYPDLRNDEQHRLYREICRKRKAQADLVVLAKAGLNSRWFKAKKNFNQRRLVDRAPSVVPL